MSLTKSIILKISKKIVVLKRKFSLPTGTRDFESALKDDMVTDAL
jgi:hypothetical protein